MTKKTRIPGTEEAWETGQLGRDEEFVKRSGKNIEKGIDEALELQLISIRLQKSLIEDFKYIATLNGIGYQPLMRQILKRFVDGEKKRILREAAGEAEAQLIPGKPQQRQRRATERRAKERKTQRKAA